MNRGPRVRALAVTLAVALASVACGTAEPRPPGERGPDAEAASLNAFGFDLLSALDADTGNVIVSPVSVPVLLGMVLAGADGETAAEIARALHLPDDRSTFEAVLASLESDDVVVRAANALWAQPGVRFRDDYLEVVRAAYDARVERADLGAPATVDEIDAWVRDRTEGLIDRFARALGLPDPSAILVLLNAVYFKGQWAMPFSPDATRPEPFTLPDGQRVNVPLMHRPPTRFGHASRSGYEVLRMTYGETDRFGMEVFLPDGNLGDLLQRLDEREWRAATDDLTERQVEVFFPRFDLEWGAQLNEVLAGLGIETAFGSGADFSRMTGQRAWLSVVAHRARVITDEEGTEAAAVTGGAMVTSAPATPPPVFRADRPFAFTISDGSTILFAGTVTDPRG